MRINILKIEHKFYIKKASEKLLTIYIIYTYITMHLNDKKRIIVRNVLYGKYTIPLTVNIFVVFK